MNTTNPTHLWTVTDTSENTRLSRSFLYERIRTGELPSYKVGGRRLLHPDSVMSWLEAQPGETST
jgi:excisionase family DNA binding protein